MDKKMDTGFAVFNCHINNADWRAKCLVSAEFGPDGLKEISKASEEGIMSIFNVPPTPVTQFYAERVTEFVNEGRED